MIKQKFKSFIKTRLPAFVKVLAGLNLIFFSGAFRKGSEDIIYTRQPEKDIQYSYSGIFDKTVQIPLVIALHGRGANGASMIFLTHKGFNKMADKDGFIMVLS